jgi:23S rRNA (adenine2503-C2)-methyltransferase
MEENPQPPLFGLSGEELAACMAGLGEPAWRGRQLAEALYRQRIADLEGVTTLPKAMRRRLREAGWEIGRPRIARSFRANDGTERYLIECPGPKAQSVETVWMPEGDGSGDEDDSSLPAPDSSHGEQSERPMRRATLCVSSQVGCAVNCRFCLTARLGFERHLTAGEIAGQVVAVLDRHGVEVGRDRVNLVFMGMGEPLLNYGNFMAAVRLLVREAGLSPRRMTLSTAGVVPGIERLAAEPDELRPRLAVSLNAPDDRLRDELMPINRKWPIAAVIEALRHLRLRPHERITFEYVLLGGVNDRPEQAAEVARLVRRSGLAAKVNLIAWNPGPEIGYATPLPEAIETFRATLTDAGISVYRRKARGREIYAACGQLKRTVEG